MSTITATLASREPLGTRRDQCAKGEVQAGIELDHADHLLSFFQCLATGWHEGTRRQLEGRFSVLRSQSMREGDDLTVTSEGADAKSQVVTECWSGTRVCITPLGSKTTTPALHL
eukprot:104329-Rhodomonas_salina.3